jgi:hypothetical protein
MHVQISAEESAGQEGLQALTCSAPIANPDTSDRADPMRLWGRVQAQSLEGQGVRLGERCDSHLGDRESQEDGGAQCCGNGIISPTQLTLSV